MHDQADLPATVLRLPAVYGPGDTQHRLRAYLRQMDDGRPSIPLPDGQADWRWTRGYVENVASSCPKRRFAVRGAYEPIPVVASGFRVAVRRVPIRGRASGRVVGQLPLAGYPVHRNDIVELTVAR